MMLYNMLNSIICSCRGMQGEGALQRFMVIIILAKSSWSDA